MPHARCRDRLPPGLRPVLLALLLAGLGSGASADDGELLSREEREALDLSEYRVNDPDAGYFDVASRAAELEATDNSILLQELDNLSRGPSCRQLLEYDPITNRVRIPGYYPNPDEWELASEPLFRFEDNVSMLTGSFVASGDPYYAECLVHYLNHWAEAEALTDFHYDSLQPQAWFATESMLFAAGMAYATVRPYVEGLEEERGLPEVGREQPRHLGQHLLVGVEGRQLLHLVGGQVEVLLHHLGLEAGSELRGRAAQLRELRTGGGGQREERNGLSARKLIRRVAKPDREQCTANHGHDCADHDKTPSDRAQPFGSTVNGVRKDDPNQGSFGGYGWEDIQILLRSRQRKEQHDRCDPDKE